MTSPNGTDPVVLTVDETLQLLRGTVGRSSLYKYLRAGVIPHRRVGKKILILKSSLMAWLEGADSRPQPGRGGADDRG